MDRKVLIGIVSDVSGMETLLNNLVEADFNEKDISVIMQDQKKARAYAKDTGPLKGVSLDRLDIKLHQLHIPQEKISKYTEMLKKDAALIAITVDAEAQDAAEEMLRDYFIQQIEIV